MKSVATLAFIAFVIAVIYNMAVHGDDIPNCQDRGAAYYKEIGSYPRLSTGELADEKIKGMCGRNANAFQ